MSQSTTLKPHLRKRTPLTIALRWLHSFREFGITTTLALKSQRFGMHLTRWRCDRIRKFIFRHYQDIASAPVDETSILPMGKNFPIWVMWWQGEEGMPPIVKTCYETLKAAADSHPVHLITRDNYSQYVDFPSYILKKVERGTITLTHFSDLMRVSLIARHGGLWVDSTILPGMPITIGADTKLYTLRTHDYFGDKFIAHCRWTGFLIGAGAGNPLFVRTRELFLRYWKVHDLLITYLFIDHVYDYFYDHTPALRAMLDAVPLSEADFLHMERHLGEKYQEASAHKHLNASPFHKLSYKMRFPFRTEDGSLTWYGYISEFNGAIPLPAEQA